MKGLFLLLACGSLGGVAAFNDYWNHYCGKANCYDLLDVPEDATLSDIKRAYRTESLRWHPDKNKAPEAHKRFQGVAKAYQVLSNEETRAKYDHHRNNQADYWTEYGHSYFTTYAPKSDVRLVLAAFLVIISVFVPIVQWNKHHTICSFLKKAAIKGLGLHEGGTKETLEIRRRALELRDQYREEAKANGDASGKDKKAKKKLKDEEDPDFLRAVDEIVDGMEIKGSYRKPSWDDVLAYRLVLLPYTLGRFLWFNAQWYYKHSYQKLPLSEEEEQYLAVRAVGQTVWEASTPEEQAEMTKARVWEGDNWEQYKQAKIEEELKKRPGLHKKYLRYRKKAAANGLDDSDEGM